MSKTLTEKDYRDAAAELGCEVAAIKAVAEVESAGAGFLADGRPKILFERHHFHRLTRGKFSAEHPDISSRQAGGYRGGAAEWARFSKAFRLNPQAAMKSASWGRFQIMGFNHEAAGFATVDAFVDAMKAGEREHLMAFVAFVGANSLARHVRAKDWAAFARGYNGAGYKKNRYDEKMAVAYRKHSRLAALEDSAAPATADQPAGLGESNSGPEAPTSPATSAAETNSAPEAVRPVENAPAGRQTPAPPAPRPGEVVSIPSTLDKVKEIAGEAKPYLRDGIGFTGKASLTGILASVGAALTTPAGYVFLGVAVGILIFWLYTRYGTNKENMRLESDRERREHELKLKLIELDIANANRLADPTKANVVVEPGGAK